MSQSIYSAKVFKPKPPDKGSFPLDHEGECKQNMTVFMQCLKTNGYDNSQCRVEAKNYLDCRMQKELMAKEEWSKLGFADLTENPANPPENPTNP
ncbi:cytochrome c oxidase assembly protein COX19-like [Paramacrobiotus metropolitanus]|uniref:cytochrome c oxidase assembly protein COX19-like n=1 Tax=Paramacrobiotus metropolitanus TaxID=2943436 RepID=UPI002445CEE4|nr:cytochrome c oxidase assembly protein COX19-like [Paramacrobiotus metropolitanus]